MKKLGILSLSIIILFATGCASPKYEGNAISADISKKKPEIEIIQDDKTREGFKVAVEDWLKKNNYSYSVKQSGSQHDLEKLTLEYVGIWRWDLALFLNSAKIEAFHEGQRVSEVTYKAPNNLNTSKFSNAKERIEYLMDVLFGKLTAQEATSEIK